MSKKTKFDELTLSLRMAWFRMLGGCPVQLGEDRFSCDPENLNFWDKVNSGSWEPGTFSVLDRLLSPEKRYCDIGSWIGPTVLYAAKRCSQVYCLEPDRVAYATLLDNIRLNGLENVLPFNLALAAKSGMLGMASPRGKRGDSMTSLLHPEGKRSARVLCLQWQSWLELVESPVFDVIKMDVEGGEFSLLPTMRDYLEKHRPPLYLSLHPHLLAEDERLQEMSQVVETLSIYTRCVDKNGRENKVEVLLEGRNLYKGSTHLLLA